MEGKLKVVTIVGARPQFIKAAPINRELARAGVEEILVHTGQHYEYGMSQSFFDALRMPTPKYQLEVGQLGQGNQTGQMLARLEGVLISERPDWVLVYGDTNSTLAGALAAAKLRIPLAHVEAGLRSFNPRMPEEVNRMVTDHLSSLLLVPTNLAVENLRREGICSHVHIVGDVMYEAAIQHHEMGQADSTILKQFGLKPKGYLLITVHRAENTDDPERLDGIVAAVRELCKDRIIVWPLHPRMRSHAKEMGLLSIENLVLTEPATYFEMLQLESNAAVVMTDSGGVQKEAQWLETPCVTLRDETEWVETVTAGWNRLAGTNRGSIVAAVLEASRPNTAPVYCTCGVSRAIAELLINGSQDSPTPLKGEYCEYLDRQSICNNVSAGRSLSPL